MSTGFLRRLFADEFHYGRGTTKRTTRKRPVLERLEVRDLPAPLTWFAAPRLAAARGGAVALAAQGAAFTLLGGGPTDVPYIIPANPAWQAISGSDVAFGDTTPVSPGAGIMPSGAILMFGGNGDGGGVADAVQYLTNAGDQPVASMHKARELLGFATDGNGLVYAIGGLDGNGTPLASMEYYTQSSNTWTYASALPQALYAESAAYDGNGHIFAFGGVGSGGTITSNVYEYTIASNTWTQVASMPIAVRDSAAVLGSNNLIYVLGGKTSSGATAAIESYNPATNTWNTETSLPAPLSDEAAVSDSLGRIEIVGGFDGNGNAVANVWASQQLNQPDSVPSVTTTPPTTAKTGIPYSYQVFSTANPQATYSLPASDPIGMTIDSNTGFITWTPGGTQIGNFPVTIVASNYAGQSNQSFTINVAQSPPTPPGGLAVTSVTDHSIGLSWNASYDPIGVSSYTVYHYYTSGIHGGIHHYDPVLTVSGTTTTGRVTGLASGARYSYVVKAFDSSGLSSIYSAIATGITSSTGTDILIVAGFPSPSTAGVAGTFTVTALNPAGSTDTSYLGTVQFTSTDYQAALPPNYTFTAADGGVHTFSATLKTASTRSITATDTVTSTITGTQSGITINPAAVSTLSVYGFASPVTAGIETTFGVSAQDAFGNYTSYLGRVHFTSSDAAANLPADYTFVTADNGIHDFTATFNTAGTQLLTATDTVTPTITGTAGGIYVNPAGTDTLSVAGFPSPSTAGVAGTFTVTALNPGGGTDTSYRGAVHFTSSDARAALPTNYAFTAADNGVHSFSATLKTAGTRWITATDNKIGTITGTLSGIIVTPAAVSALAVTAFPTPTKAGVGHAIMVRAVDPFGNTVPGYTGTIAFTSSDVKATLPAAYTFVASDNGAHKFAGLILKTAGTQSISAYDTATNSISGKESNITVNSAAASHLLVKSQTSVTAGTSFSLTVTAEDPYGNTVPGYTGTVAFTSNDPKAILPTPYTFTGTDAGSHTFTVTLETARTRSITAKDTVKTTITGAQSGIVVSPAAASHVQVTAPSTTTAGTAFTVTITALDPYGNVATGYTGTIHFTTSDPSASVVLPTDYTFTAADKGKHSFTNGVTLRTSGSQSITATDTVTSSITGSATVTVNGPLPPSPGVLASGGSTLDWFWASFPHQKRRQIFFG
jgi:hypothetical protein